MAPPPRRSSGRTRPSGPWKNGPIPVIGLVGGIGSGKSVVASRLAELGAFVIDADKVGHALLGQRPVRDEVVTRFGNQILDSSVAEGEPPTIDRGALGAIVFADSSARKALESIVHPHMRHTFEKAASRVARRGESAAVVLDAAILFEAGWDTLCDRVIFVESTREARLARVLSARGWDEPTLAAREKAQWSLDRKREKADAVILNNEGLDALKAEVDEAWEVIKNSAPARSTRRRAPSDTGTPPPGRPFGRRGR